MTDDYDLSLADYKRMENENDDAPRFERAINDADGRVLYYPMVSTKFHHRLL